MPNPPDRLGTAGWKRKKFIARGGFAQVWEYVDENIPTQQVAIKVFSGRILRERESRRKQLRNEVRILQWIGKLSKAEDVVTKVSSKRIVEYLDSGVIYNHFFSSGSYREEIECCWMAMQYCSGGTLDERRKSLTLGRMSESEVKYWSQQILEGLVWLHDTALLVHRDIKPGNLLIEQPLRKNCTSPWIGARLRIADLGLATFYQQPSTNSCRSPEPGEIPPTLSTPSRRAGTLNYFPPEIISAAYKSDGWLSDRLDIWSFGVTVLVLLMGKHPFKGNDEQETLSNIRAGHWHSRHNPTPLSAQAREFCLRLLKKCPSERPSAKTLLNDPWIPQVVDGHEKH